MRLNLECLRRNLEWMCVKKASRFVSEAARCTMRPRRKPLLYDQRRALNALACLHGEYVVSWAHALNVQRYLFNV